MIGRMIFLQVSGIVTFMIVFLNVASVIMAQTTASSFSDKIGLGVNTGFQKIFCDDPHTGYAPAGEGYLQFLLAKRFGLTFGLGYGLLSDGSLFDKSRYQTNMWIVDVKGRLILIPGGKFRPYLSLGLGMHNWQFKGDEWDPLFNVRSYNDVVTARSTSAHSISGAGFEVFLSPKVAFNALADYRFVLTSPGDNLDGRMAGNSKDSYLNLRAGLTFYFKDQLQSTMAGTERLITDYIDLESESNSPFSTSESEMATDKIDLFDTNTDALDQAGDDISMEKYLQLKSRLDQLKQRIENEFDEIETLQMSLLQKDDQITELEAEYNRLTSQPVSYQNRSTSGTIGPVNDTFSARYETGLQEYYSRNYQNAIQIFSQLISDQPRHKLVGNCHYWIGESYFALLNYNDAATAFESVFDCSGSPKMDDAALMLGKCYMKMGDVAAAREYFEKLIQEFPNSEYLGITEKLLSSLN